jgi:DNA-directed RNA polymerase specialized sigma subunit, sigma24 homolog
MPIINLRKQYPGLYTEDVFVEVSDDVAEAILLATRQENNYRRRTYRYKAYYSLDRGDGIENDALHFTPSPEEIFLRQVSLEQLQEAIDHLPPIQMRRVYAHYILGMKKVDIARAEGVDDGSVRSTIQAGLRNLRRYFEKKKWK